MAVILTHPDMTVTISQNPTSNVVGRDIVQADLRSTGWARFAGEKLGSVRVQAMAFSPLTSAEVANIEAFIAIANGIEDTFDISGDAGTLSGVHFAGAVFDAELSDFNKWSGTLRVRL